MYCKSCTIQNCKLPQTSLILLTKTKLFCIFYFIRRRGMGVRCLPLSMVRAFLRLGRKYGIDHLQAEALTRLSIDYPCTLQGYDECIKGHKTIDLEGNTHFAIVDLARENDIPSILPMAFYLCCEEAQGIDPKSRIVHPADNLDAFLPTEDMITCYLGQKRLLGLQMIETFGWLDVRSPAESAHTRCTIAKKEIFYAMSYPLTPFCPLCPWTPNWIRAMCSDCAIKAQQRHIHGRAEIWDQLPVVFGLPSWEQLK